MRRRPDHTPRGADLDRVRTIIRASGTGYALVGGPRRRPRPAAQRPRPATPEPAAPAASERLADGAPAG